MSCSCSLPLLLLERGSCILKVPSPMTVLVVVSLPECSGGGGLEAVV